MAADTAISWADHSMNFWVGCEKVSPACNNCYAEAWAIRSGHPELWEGERRRTKTWNDPLKWEAAAPAFFSEHGRRQGVFTNSLADFFDNKIAIEWRADAWRRIAICKSLNWLIVTKRVSNIEKMLPEGWTQQTFGHCIFIITVVTQAEADRDIPRLMEIKCRYPWIRIGLSIEPLLERIDLCELLGIWWNQTMECFESTGSRVNPGLPGENGIGLDWVIVGGESGGAARPMNISWLRSLRNQCLGAGVPFHFKQYGEWLTFSKDSPCFLRDTKGYLYGAKVDGVKYMAMRDIHLFKDGNIAVRVGKNRTGRLLDGVLYNEFPKEVSA